MTEGIDAATPFWDATREHRLVLPWCATCQRAFWFPRSICPHCGGDDIGWIDASGSGEVYAVSVHHRAPARDFPLEAPYVVALVELDEGVRMMSNVVGCPPHDVTVGLRVRATWAPLDDGRHLLHFEPDVPNGNAIRT